MPPFTVRLIDHVVLRVRDLERSVHFYAVALGCAVERRRPDLGLVHLRAGASLVDLVDLNGKLGRMGGAGPGQEGRNVDHLCLRIDSFEERALVSHLSAHSVPLRGSVTQNFGAEGVGPSLYVEDPDGNIVELKGPPVRAGESDA